MRYKREGDNIARTKAKEWHKYRPDELIGHFTTTNETIGRIYCEQS